MCICCCITRQSLLIYTIVISVIAIAYGAYAISNFGSDTTIYKMLISKIEELEKENKQNSRILSNEFRSLDDAQDILDNSNLSKKRIRELSYKDINNVETGFVKALYDVEHGAGIAIFVLSILYFVISIIYLFFSCGEKEFMPLNLGVYCLLTILGSICSSLAGIFCGVCVLYAVCLAVAFYAYFLKLLIPLDGCLYGIIYQFVFAIYMFWYFIIVSCAFCSIRTHIIATGNVENIGPRARFDANGNPIQPQQNPVIVVTNQQSNEGNAKSENYLKVNDESNRK